MALDKRVENVVAEARLGGPFDIIELSERVRGAQYRPDRFMGLIVHVRGGSGLVFEDGHVVTTGARGTEAALAQMEDVRDLLARAGADTTSVEGFHLRNVVVSADLGTRVPLDQVRMAFPDDDMDLDTERFPGIVWRREDPRHTLLLFPGGKLIGTGTDDLAAVEVSLDEVANELRGRRLVGAV